MLASRLIWRTRATGHQIPTVLNPTKVLIGALIFTLVATACASDDSVTLAPPSPDHLATPNRAETIVIDADAPPDVTSRDAKRYYRDGFKHMRNAEWFSAVAAYSEVIHLHPNAASAYAARGTAHLYGGDHQHAIKDYTTAIKNAPDNASYWRRRAHAWSTADPPEAQKAIDDATRAIELDPTHHMGYGHRAIAYTLLSNPDWHAALADMDQSIPLHPQHDSEAYKFRAWIHENLGNHAAAERDRQSAQQHP